MNKRRLRKHPPADTHDLSPQSVDNMQFYLNSNEAWDGMYSDCREARQSINIEQYIFANDEIGERFMQLFRSKAEKGVKVRLLLDKVGSYDIFKSDWPRKLKEHGAQVRFYNPVNWLYIFKPFSIFPRNHAKILLIDDSVAYLGSACIDQKMADWRDTQVRFTGPIIQNVKYAFHALWNHRPGPRPADLRGAPVEYVAVKPFSNRVYRELMIAIGGAKKHIKLATPYFLPSRRFVRYLKQAVRRGVPVTLIVTDRSDVWFADAVIRSYLGQLIRAGVRIYMYQHRVFHAKYAIIDDDWATVGSMNLDYLSFFRNREANLIIRDLKIIGELTGHFETDLRDCQPYTLEEWKNRPWHRKLLGRLGRPFRRFL